MSKNVNYMWMWMSLKEYMFKCFLPFFKKKKKLLDSIISISSTKSNCEFFFSFFAGLNFIWEGITPRDQHSNIPCVSKKKEKSCCLLLYQLHWRWRKISQGIKVDSIFLCDVIRNFNLCDNRNRKFMMTSQDSVALRTLGKTQWNA